MAAYNWIKIKDHCPSCHKEEMILCQTHVASSYDGVAEERFHDQTFALGEKMSWFTEDDPRYESWKVDGGPKLNLKDAEIHECCYSDCLACKAELFVVIEFRDLVPV